MATGSEDNTSRVFEASTGKEIARIQHRRPVNSVVFSRDGRSLATSSDDGTSRVVEPVRGELLRLPHERSVDKVSFSGDRRWIVTRQRVGNARVFDTDSGKETPLLGQPEVIGPFGDSVAFSPDGRWVATAGLDGRATGARYSQRQRAPSPDA